MVSKAVLLVLFIITSAEVSGFYCRSGSCYGQRELAQDVSVTIPNGKINGRQGTTYSQKVFYVFHEIPYAQPPVGSLRFMPPVAAQPWDGEHNGTENLKLCYQMASISGSEIQTEDCLYVNVYTPVDPSSNASLPVIAYIYGEGVFNKNPLFRNFGPQYFMEQDVVIVAISYRSGPFGFLSTGDTVIPGNMGLKDQIMALKWVQDNIQYFGGDPTKVTVFGYSLGGVSATLHILSEQSQGLFRGVISQSGSPLCPWAYQRDHKNIAYNMATRLDPSFSQNASSQELLTFLQSKTARQILDSTEYSPWDTGRYPYVQGLQFAPVVEPIHDGAFLTQSMYDAVAAGGANLVPLMMGITSEEEREHATNINRLNYQLIQYDLTPDELVNDNMHIENDTTKTAVGEAIRNIYTTKQLQEDVAAGIRYLSDTSFSRAIIHHAKLYSQFNDVYFYQFSYHTDQVWDHSDIADTGKAGHGDDNLFLWAYLDNGNIQQRGSAREILNTKRYVTLFANFAKTLNPTPEVSDLFQNLTWPTVSIDNYQYLDINDNLTVQTDPKGDVYNKWVDLYETSAVKPYDTF